MDNTWVEFRVMQGGDRIVRCCINAWLIDALAEENNQTTTIVVSHGDLEHKMNVAEPYEEVQAKVFKATGHGAVQVKLTKENE